MWSLLLIWLFGSVFHILSCTFGSIFYLCIYSCMFCVPAFNSVSYVFLSLCTLCSVYSVSIVPACTLRLPWLKFFHAFSSAVRQMPGHNSQRLGTARTLPKSGNNFYAVSSSLTLVWPHRVRIPENLPTKVVNCVVLCTVCVWMCTVLLPPGVNPIAVNRYIISYHHKLVVNSSLTTLGSNPRNPSKQSC